MQLTPDTIESCPPHVVSAVLQIVDPVFDTLEITETSSITIDLDVISSGVSLAMNGVITGLIGLKAWC